MYNDEPREDQSWMCEKCFHSSKTKFETCPQCGAVNSGFDIDDGMVEIVRELNNKGYITIMCCEGHVDRQYTKTFKEVAILFSFAEKYDFDFGGEWSPVGKNIWWNLMIVKRVPTKTKKQLNGNWKEELETWRQNKLEEISAKVKDLPIISQKERDANE